MKDFKSVRNGSLLLQQIKFPMQTFNSFLPHLQTKWPFVVISLLSSRFYRYLLRYITVNSYYHQHPLHLKEMYITWCMCSCCAYAPLCTMIKYMTHTMQILVYSITGHQLQLSAVIKDILLPDRFKTFVKVALLIVLMPVLWQ